jgi:hypothetical protein
MAPQLQIIIVELIGSGDALLVGSRPRFVAALPEMSVFRFPFVILHVGPTSAQVEGAQARLLRESNGNLAGFRRNDPRE